MDDTSDWWRLSGASCVHNSAEWQQPSSGGFFRREKAPKEQEKYHTNWTRKSPKKQRFSWPSTAFNSFPTAESHCFYKRHWRRSSRFTSWPFHSIHSFIHSSSTNSINLKRTICLRTVTIQPKLSEPMVEINRCSYIIDHCIGPNSNLFRWPPDDLVETPSAFGNRLQHRWGHGNNP